MPTCVHPVLASCGFDGPSAWGVVRSSCLIGGPGLTLGSRRGARPPAARRPRLLCSLELKDIAEKQAPDVNKLIATLTDAESFLIAKQINISGFASPLTSTTPRGDPGNGADLSLDVVDGNCQHHCEEAVSLRKDAMEGSDESHSLSDVSSSQKLVECSCNQPSVSDSREILHQNTDNDPRSPTSCTSAYNGDRGEIIEQFVPGVYATLVLLRNGVKAFKQVRFSKRRFAEQQAEEWWRQNKDRIFNKYGSTSVDLAPYTQPKAATVAEDDGVALTTQS